MNMQSAALTGQKVISLEEVKAKLLQTETVPPLTFDLEVRLKRKLRKLLGTEKADDAWKILVAELWPHKPEAPKPVATGKVLNFSLGEPRKRNNAKKCTVVRQRPCRKKQEQSVAVPVSQPAQVDPELRARRLAEKKALKQLRQQQDSRERRRLARLNRRKAKQQTQQAAKAVVDAQQVPDRRKAKSKAPVVKTGASTTFVPPAFTGELRQPVAKASLETAARKAVKPPVKRKSFTARVAPADQAWWDSVSKDGYIITFWLERFGLKETYWLAGEEQELLVETMWFKLHPPLEEQETAFDRTLREAEEALAAERALRQTDEPPQAPKPKGKKKRESKLQGAEKSRQQNELKEQREKQEAEAAEEQQKAETLVVPASSAENVHPCIKQGRTKKQEALEAKKRKPKRHAKERMVIQAKPKRHSADKPELHPWNIWVAERKASLREDFADIREMEVMRPIGREQELEACFAPLFLQTAQMIEEERMQLEQCTDNILALLELRTLEKIDRLRVMRELPMVNPLLTLAGMLARVFHSPA